MGGVRGQSGAPGKSAFEQADNIILPTQKHLQSCAPHLTMCGVIFLRCFDLSHARNQSQSCSLYERCNVNVALEFVYLHMCNVNCWHSNSVLDMQCDLKSTDNVN